MELRDIFGGSDRIPTPSQAGGAFTYAGRFVSTDDAIALPTIMAGIRLLAETAGSLPLMVHKTENAIRTPALDAPQWALLHDKPNALQTPFAVVSYLIMSMHTSGGAFLQKMKDGRQVMELWPLNPSRVKAEVTDNEMVFKVKDPATNKVRTVTRDDIIYLPGVLVDNPYIGTSPLSAHRQSIATAVATDEFAGRYFQNDGTPSGLIVKGPQRKEQRDELRESWEGRHRGLKGAHRLGVLWGDMDYKPLAINAKDAAMIESKKYTVEEGARILRLPAWMLGGVDQSPRLTPEQRNMEFLQFSLAPWLARIEQPLHADDDLFPDKTLRPTFDVDALLRADIAARTQAYLQGRQAGWLSSNDIRFKEGLPPVAGGDVYQQTPVGGAPALQPGGNTENTPNEKV
ncbi:MAG: phage portal protein [Mycobacterium sp.]